MGARNWLGIGLSYRPARLYKLTEFILWNRFLGSINVWKYGLCLTYRPARARICKPVEEPRNRFPAWRAGTTRLAESIPGFLKRLQIRALKRKADVSHSCSLSNLPPLGYNGHKTKRPLYWTLCKQKINAQTPFLRYWSCFGCLCMFQTFFSNI